MPDPLNVQRRTPAQVALGALGDLGQEGQPELLIPWKYFEGKNIWRKIFGGWALPVYGTVDDGSVVEVFHIINFLQEVQLQQTSLGMH